MKKFVSLAALTMVLFWIIQAATTVTVSNAVQNRTTAIEAALEEAK